MVKGTDCQFAVIVTDHLIRAGADRVAGKIRQFLPFMGQNGGVRAAGQYREPAVGLIQCDIDNVRHIGTDSADMAEQPMCVTQALKRGNDIHHLQLTAVMEKYRRAQPETPLFVAGLLPVMRQRRDSFPVFLIYCRQSVKNLAQQMDFRAA